MTKKIAKKDEPTEIPSAPAVFDISKPGETAAHPTSRPVIVGHTSTLKQDPMMSPQNETEVPEKPEENLTKKAEAIVEPILEEKPEEEAEKQADEEEKIEPEVEAKSEDGTETEEKSDSSESGEIEALANEAESKNQSKHDQAESEKENEKLQELSATKKYFLPIREGGKKRSGEIVLLWFLLFLIIATALAWFVVDAGYYDPGFELPYDFIKN